MLTLRGHPQGIQVLHRKEHAMGWLDPDELRQVLPAETASSLRSCVASGIGGA